MSPKKVSETSERRKIRLGRVLVNSPRGLNKKEQDEWFTIHDRLRRRAKAGLDPLMLPTEFMSFCTTWINNRKETHPQSTWGADEYRLRLHVLPHAPIRTHMHKIQSGEWRDIFKNIQVNGELSDATMNRIRALVHKIYQDAMTSNPPRVGFNPIAHIKPNEETTHLNEPDFYSVEECHAYLAAANTQGTLHKLIAMIYINGGVRKSEPIAIQWGDINFTLGRIKISKIHEQCSGEIRNRTKSGKSKERYLGINAPLRRVLLEWKKETPFSKPDDFVIHDGTGKRVDSYFITRLHAHIEKIAGTRHVRVHDLRHTFSSHYVMNGGSIRDLQLLLGHSSPLMTQRYTHLQPGYLESKASVVSFDVPNDEKNVIDLNAKRGG